MVSEAKSRPFGGGMMWVSNIPIFQYSIAYAFLDWAQVYKKSKLK